MTVCCQGPNAFRLPSQAQLPGLSITLPVTIFGIFALIASIVTLWLPETIYANMHQTIEEAEAAEDDFKAPCLRKDKAKHIGKDTANMAESKPLENEDNNKQVTAI